ncbi:hypothetical protein GUJ93_ZPchr0013g35869 [Zizania palustris]|uniref:Uncharacterized protein n=1 Tax=Zizania palustris TaxID=103762 RepID=A0A8J5WZC2_ZIZPA|nr:hypothetical protein GUJ93_ZPchr0013g35869 [Zizania palustris]
MDRRGAGRAQQLAGDADATVRQATGPTVLARLGPLEYNLPILPVLEVQRSQVDHVENMEIVDWGLIEEDITNVPAQGFECRMDKHGHDNELGQDNDGVFVPTSDAIPEKKVTCKLVPSAHTMGQKKRGSVGNLGRMLQKLRHQNLALHGDRLEQKSYGIVLEGSLQASL